MRFMLADGGDRKTRAGSQLLYYVNPRIECRYAHIGAYRHSIPPYAREIGHIMFDEHHGRGFSVFTYIYMYILYIMANWRDRIDLIRSLNL